MGNVQVEVDIKRGKVVDIYFNGDKPEIRFFEDIKDE